MHQFRKSTKVVTTFFVFAKNGPFLKEFNPTMATPLILLTTVSFTDLDQEREILSRFSLPKSMKHSVDTSVTLCV